jgi:DNA-binding NarL/FixJ family response regulator
MYEGKTNQQMAESLYVSVNTIKTHIANVYLKLEVSSRTAALVKVRAWI